LRQLNFLQIHAICTLVLQVLLDGQLAHLGVRMSVFWPLAAQAQPPICAGCHRLTSASFVIASLKLAAFVI
jgi:hypothetical protein